MALDAAARHSPVFEFCLGNGRRGRGLIAAVRAGLCDNRDIMLIHLGSNPHIAYGFAKGSQAQLQIEHDAWRRVDQRAGCRAQAHV